MRLCCDSQENGLLQKKNTDICPEMSRKAVKFLNVKKPPYERDSKRYVFDVLNYVCE